ncbi:MAG: penicillin acylase family protein [Kofleriaceae bacterium]
MAGARLLLPALAAIVACSEDEAPGPFDQLPQDGEFIIGGLDRSVQVARDRFGIAHVSGSTSRDVAFVQGYVTAHDRLPQLDLLRRFASGTLAEQYGIADPTSIDVDLEMRLHRIRLYADQTFLAMQAEPNDAELVEVLQRFADGVNAYHVDLLAAKWNLADPVAELFQPQTFAAWTPVDSLAVLRMHTLAASFTVPYELELGARYAAVDASLANDLVRFAPAARASTLAEFPNVSVDTGSRSDAKPARTRAVAYGRAREFFAQHYGAGSSAWAIGAPVTTGSTLLAGAQHGDLANPSSFYPIHLVVPGRLDVLGVALPGVPGVILGSTGSLAWTTAGAGHDVNDVYAETSCPQVDCVVFNGSPVDLESYTEEIVVGDRGLPDHVVTARYEVVGHHGPLIPEIDRTTHQLVPRDPTAPILSIRYVGYQPTFELRALWQLAHAETVDQGFAALADITVGAASYMMIDNQSHIGWSMHGFVPQRPASAYTWHPANPTGNAPFFALAGDGTAEWLAEPLSSRYLPHAKDPATGILVATGADPVGATFDGDPLNAALVDARPLYVGTAYTAGFQQQRIAQVLAEQPAVLATMQRLLRDTHSNAGAAITPKLLEAFAPASPPPDLAAFTAGLSAADTARLATARTVLEAWTFRTPGSVDVAPADPDSAATAVFAEWTRAFFRRTVCDDLPACASVGGEQMIRIVHGLVVEPTDFVQLAATGQPRVCDDRASPGAESCTTMILRAAIEAVTVLEAAFANPSPTTWQWGQLHQLQLAPSFSTTAALQLEFPRDGDNFAVDRSDAFGESFTSRDGAAQRFVALADPGEKIRVQWQLPGGTIFDPRNPHYRDLLDSYYLREAYFDAPFTVDDIITNGEYRWDFR